MTKIRHDQTLSEKRRLRVRSKMHGTASRPRLSVFRSNKSIYLQVIDDDQAKTLVASNSKQLKKTKQKLNKTEIAVLVAKDLAEKLKNKKIKNLVFDRGSYKYHGRVKAVAATLREAGIKL